MNTTIDEDDIDFKEFRDLFLYCYHDATPQLQLEPQVECNDELVVQLVAWIKAHDGYIPSCMATDSGGPEARMASAYARYKHSYARNDMTPQVRYLLSEIGYDVYRRRSYRWYLKQ